MRVIRLLFALTVLTYFHLAVDAVPGNLNCDGEQWKPGQPFLDDGGDMGNIPTYTAGPASDCRIEFVGGQPASIIPCASYVIRVVSDGAVGHKLSTNAGLLQSHPEFTTEGQNDRCRHMYSQTETRYIYKASTSVSQHKFYSICGKVNSPLNVKTLTVDQQGSFPTTPCGSCISPLGTSNQVNACYLPTASPTPEPPGTALNTDGLPNATIASSSSSTVIMLSMAVFWAMMLLC